MDKKIPAPGEGKYQRGGINGDTDELLLQSIRPPINSNLLTLIYGRWFQTAAVARHKLSKMQNLRFFEEL